MFTEDLRRVGGGEESYSMKRIPKSAMFMIATDMHSCGLTVTGIGHRVNKQGLYNNLKFSQLLPLSINQKFF